MGLNPKDLGGMSVKEWNALPRRAAGDVVYWPLSADETFIRYFCSDGEAYIQPRLTLEFLDDAVSIEDSLRWMLARQKKRAEVG